MSIGVFSYLAAVLAYLTLTILLVTAWRGRLMGFLAVAAAVATLAWAGVGAAISAGLEVPVGVSGAAELARNGAWFLFLASILAAEDDHSGRRRAWIWAAWWVIALGGLLTLVFPAAIAALELDLTRFRIFDLVIYGWILQVIFGLLLIEQVVRNRLPQRRWEIKHLCVGLGALFAYDLFFYSDALLLQRMDRHIWEARGMAQALIVPLVAVSAARNPQWSLDVHVSRNVVFHSATLFSAGVYLMAMAAAGYSIRFLGGNWGPVLQIAFLFSSGVLLVVLLFSGGLRSRLRMWLSRHFFSFKYDYRAEWLRFTRELTRGGVHLPEAVVRALGAIVASPGGALWARHDRGVFERLASVNLAEPANSILLVSHPMVGFLKNADTIVDLHEFRKAPDLYPDLEVPEWLDQLSTAWLIIPLFLRDDLSGFVVLERSFAMRSINWEDRSLLKTAGSQAASHVAQYLSDQALIRAHQFEAFNQLSAYVAHDLKNLLAQQSLILSNADKHKDNPAFVEDVIRTIKSSVERMTRLMSQLRNGNRDAEQCCLQLDRVIRDAIALHEGRHPSPYAVALPGGVQVKADAERLRTIIGHLIQNAQEATRADGYVCLRLTKEARLAIIDIEDNGVGMTADFIRERLFRPFDSTKGLTGMGIGAFESREYVRYLGGDLTVRSTPGQGTLFRIYLPCAAADSSGIEACEERPEDAA